MSLKTPWHPDTHEDLITASLATLVSSTDIQALEAGKAEILNRLDQSQHGSGVAVAKLSDLLLTADLRSGRSAYVLSLDSASDFAESIAGPWKISTL